MNQVEFLYKSLEIKELHDNLEKLIPVSNTKIPAISKEMGAGSQLAGRLPIRIYPVASARPSKG